AGFVVSGATPKRVLVRGIGPGLAAFGVKGTVADPALKLFLPGKTDAIAQNDDWQTAQLTGGGVTATATEISAAAAATGAFPLASGSKDAGLLITLAPGNYSAVMSGANNGTGAG